MELENKRRSSALGARSLVLTAIRFFVLYKELSCPDKVSSDEVIFEQHHQNQQFTRINLIALTKRLFTHKVFPELMHCRLRIDNQVAAAFTFVSSTFLIKRRV